MPCYHPKQAYRSIERHKKSGLRKIIWDKKQAAKELVLHTVFTLPCQTCIGCRLERSRQWAMRCVHEASLYSQNCFITLTFNDESINDPSICKNPWTLDVRHMQAFFRRLRKFVNRRVRFSKRAGRLGPNKPYRKVRYYHSGEYGDLNARPHYHALIFNYDFSDREYFKTVNGIKYYTSATLSKLWPYGFVVIGDLTFESAAYVARYCTKLYKGDDKDVYYQIYDLQTGEVVDRRPEYSTMSRRSGIGNAWFNRYSGVVYPHDWTVIRNRKMKPPRYYDKLFEQKYPDKFKKVVLKRKDVADRHASDNTLMRLMVKERNLELSVKKLMRGLDNT